MPQNDRHRTRIVPIEFEANERMGALPLADRVSIVLITNGKASLLLNQQAVTLVAPSILLISQGDEIKLVEATKLAAKSFSFRPTFINSSLTFERLFAKDFTEMEDEHDCNMVSLFFRRDAYFNGAIDLPAKTYLRLSEWLAIIGTEVYAQSDGYWTCRIRRYLLQTLYLIDDIYMDRKKPNMLLREKSPVDILLEYIHTNYPNEISLDKLCDLVHINRTSLNRNFKAQTGRTAMDYVAHHRIKIACDALSHTNLSLNEISEAIGFRYDTYFIKQFTAKMSLSPTEYRQQVWGK